MKLVQIQSILKAEVISGAEGLEAEIVGVCACDLMSDVLSFAPPGAVLLTGLTNPQIVRAAEMAELAGVCVVRGKRPDPDTVALASEKGIPLLSTRHSLYEACGLLHAAGVPGCIRA